MEAVLFLLAPLAMCFLLVGIHCYLGLHVLARGVIFIDLALAQVAALGTMFAFIIGWEHSESGSYFVSLGFTFLAAIYLAIVNRRAKSQVSQEAVIGTLYAFASAAVILAIDKVSHGAEHLKQALIGQLLWVTWEDVVKVAIIYGLVAVVHIVFRRQLLKSSEKGSTHWGWDFLFFALFGLVITSSVHYSGVLLVFAFLIVPASISSMIVTSLKAKLIVGFALTTIGLLVSYKWDLPAGAGIVVTFTIVPLLLYLFVPFRKS
jgi:zinc/manganese transport system permease protein